MKETGPDKKKILRVGLVAGALAAGAPAQGHTNYTAEHAPSPGIEQHYDDVNRGYEDFSSYDRGGDQYISEEVITLFNKLDNDIRDSHATTPEQVNKIIHGAIDDFVAKHPAHEGKKIEEKDVQSGTDVEELPYSPWVELEEGLRFGPERNPLILGVAMVYIKEMLGILPPAESK
ncbi:MAG TPA: hypothetical protein VG102_00600 [Candidatus Paceibacterota bacterium]|jgi:hypothetical protein|nr:hypothetical protein [Candidatus Paceibacterota bacterium]